jgi:hypothetical protein
MATYEQYLDWRAVKLDIISVEEYESRWGKFDG